MIFAVWSEGYNATGENSPAVLLGTADTPDFDSAVRFVQARSDSPELYHQHDDGHWTYWGCRLFDNRTEAVISFG